jgi:hypothetical protein
VAGFLAGKVAAAEMGKEYERRLRLRRSPMPGRSLVGPAATENRKKRLKRNGEIKERIFLVKFEK